MPLSHKSAKASAGEGFWSLSGKPYTWPLALLRVFGILGLEFLGFRVSGFRISRFLVFRVSGQGLLGSGSAGVQGGFGFRVSEFKGVTFPNPKLETPQALFA